MRQRRPDPAPLDIDAVTIVTVGTGVWLLALIAAIVFSARLRADGHGWWIATCAAGAALGVLGVRYCRRRRTAQRPPAPPARRQP